MDELHLTPTERERAESGASLVRNEVESARKTARTSLELAAVLVTLRASTKEARFRSIVEAHFELPYRQAIALMRIHETRGGPRVDHLDAAQLGDLLERIASAFCVDQSDRRLLMTWEFVRESARCLKTMTREHRP